eukprot:1161737-Pelagomonas_calceolata.AAC.4
MGVYTLPACKGSKAQRSVMGIHTLPACKGSRSVMGIHTLPACKGSKLSRDAKQGVLPGTGHDYIRQQKEFLVGLNMPASLEGEWAWAQFAMY